MLKGFTHERSRSPQDSANFAALAMATDANGQVDLTALEAHRLILNNLTIKRSRILMLKA
ncbi:hypothetical protein ACI6Q5_12040 [Xanthomonas codiaei]|uniref:Uncharacterized protein n=1 Tax=Xanthomonas codiaei TaxID=56463 RepID=A0ABW9MN80_9XANT|nr:hypothetical protein [Xanthomonas codiaei]